MESERYMFIIYKTYISHITFMSQMLFSFEAFSLSLLVVGTIPDVETLLISVLQDIAKLRTPTFTSSGTSSFHVFSFCTAKMLQDNFASTA